MKSLICSTAAGLAAAIVAACSPTDVCGCSPVPPPAALVYGTVTNPAGDSVPGADVIIEIADPGCGSARYALGTGRTNEGGDYRIRVVYAPSPTVGECLRAFAHSPTSQWIASDPVPFAVRFAVSEPLDSVRVDLQLRDP